MERKTLMQGPCFSSTRTDWPTPAEFFEKCSERFGPFDLDVCATAENAKCSKFISPKEDSLSLPWSGVCWMNPPYGRDIKLWVAKACKEVLEGRAERVVCLLPSRTDTKWWHEIVQPYASRIEFVKGRIKFEGAKESAPFPSVIVVFSRAISGGS